MAPPLRWAGMSHDHDASGAARLEKYFSGIGDVLRFKSRRASFAAYALGLLADGERKSMEPIAARVWGDAQHAGCGHQKLQYFISEAEWDDRAVRRAAAMYAIEALSQHEPVRTWIIDDTGFLKQGRHSVGVQRQYTGSAGKIANCQIGVSLSVATEHAHVPIDLELFCRSRGATTPSGGENAAFRRRSNSRRRSSWRWR